MSLSVLQLFVLWHHCFILCAPFCWLCTFTCIVTQWWSNVVSAVICSGKCLDRYKELGFWIRVILNINKFVENKGFAFLWFATFWLENICVCVCMRECDLDLGLSATIYWSVRLLSTSFLLLSLSAISHSLALPPPLYIYRYHHFFNISCSPIYEITKCFWYKYLVL